MRITPLNSNIMKNHLVISVIDNQRVYATRDGYSSELKSAGIFTEAEADKIASDRTGYDSLYNREEEWTAVSLEDAEMQYAEEEDVEIAVIEAITAPYGPNRTVDVSTGGVRYSFELGQGGNVSWPECFGEDARSKLAERVKEKSGAHFVTYSRYFNI